jgi:hypothetical protein
MRGPAGSQKVECTPGEPRAKYFYVDSLSARLGADCEILSRPRERFRRAQESFCRDGVV